jgi:TetR/AcrR family transcriptional regulator
MPLNPVPWVAPVRKIATLATTPVVPSSRSPRHSTRLRCGAESLREGQGLAFRGMQGLPRDGSFRKIVFNYLLLRDPCRPMPRPTLAPAAPRQRLTTSQRQREIVATVLALACERGPEAITTQAIADRMGLTQGAVYRHFPDKETIWLAVFAWVRESLGAAFAAAMDKPGSSLARIERAFFAHVAFIAENPGVPRVMFHELQYPGDSHVRAEVRAMMMTYRQRLTALFAQAKAAGELPADLDTMMAPMLFIGAVQSLVIQASLAGNEAGMVKRARKLFPLLLDGYRGRGKS